MKQIKQSAKLWINRCGKIMLLIFISNISIGCNSLSQNISQQELGSIDTSQSKQPIKVDVKTANLSSLSFVQEYKGTTQPQKQVSWRSQTEGTLLELSVEVGDKVDQGQLIGRLDDSILETELAGKIGELAALQSELAQAKIQVTNAQIKLEEAEIQLEQAKSEAVRYQNLAETGLIAQQQAESFKIAAKIAKKSLLTAREAVKLEQQAVAIVEGRIATQRSAISESEQRQTYSQIIAPIRGTVMAKAKDSGSLIRLGEEVVTIGDFSLIKIVMPLSELDLGKINVGQGVKVKLDAFSDLQFRGRVNRIAPITNPSSRQIPVEIVINNPDNQIKGGLLARVSFASIKESSIIVPKIAIIEERGASYIFTVKKNGNDQTNVTKRKVVIGDRINDTVEIISGISAGEKYVVRSSKPLKDKDLVGLSIISR